MKARMELDSLTLPQRQRARTSWLGRWPTWTPYMAAVWSLGYGALGLFWSLGGPGFPFGRANDPSAALTPFEGARAAVGGPVIAALGLVGGVVAMAMARGRRRGALSITLVVLAWIAAVALIIIVPDYRPLLALAYSPLVVIGAPFGWPPHVGLGDIFPWPVVNQLVCMAGGVLWAGSAVAFRRRIQGRCGHCGRANVPIGWTTQAGAARWGKRATAVAVIIPLLYALTRYAWAVGIPLGITEEFLREGQATGLWWAGAALATLAVGGAILTLGLVRPWGETFPRWIPFVARKRVHLWLPVIVASVVSVLVTSAGVMFIRLELTGALSDTFAFGRELSWAALAPELLWPVWGVALAAATLAYYYRRRGRCEHCGRL
jgi:hypothetical protein